MTIADLWMSGSRSNERISAPAKRLIPGLALDLRSFLPSQDLVTLGLLLVAASVFYLASSPIAYAPALVVVTACIWHRPYLGLAAVVIFAPLFMAPKHLGSKEFAPSEIFLVLTAVLAFTGWTSARPRQALMWSRLLKSPFLPGLLLLLLAATVSTIFAADRHQALQRLREVIVEPIAFFALTQLLLNRTRQWWLMAASLVVAGVAVSVLGLGQAFTGQDLSVVPGTSIHRVQAAYGSPDNLGLLYDRVIPFCFALLLFGGFRRSLKLSLMASGALLAVVLFLTGSRGGWISVAAACLLLLAVAFQWGKWVAVAGVCLAVLVGTVAHQRVAVAFNSGHAHTVQRRVDLWRSSGQMIRDHPVVGVGLDNFLHFYAPRHQLYSPCRGLGYMKPSASDEPCLSHPHNVVLDFWLSTGVLGLAAFLWLQYEFWRLAASAWRKWHGLPECALVAGAIAAMSASLLHGLVDNSYFLIDMAILFWFFSGLVGFLAPTRPGTSSRETASAGAGTVGDET